MIKNPSKEATSLKKKSLKHATLGRKQPTEEQLNVCEYNMTMAQLKDPNNGIFYQMPKSVIVNGKKIPRTALRKRDLCRFYLMQGGAIGPKTRRQIKNYTVPKKPSIEQTRYEKLLNQRKLDHKPSKAKTSLPDTNKKRHASISPSRHTSSLLRQMNRLKVSGVTNSRKKQSREKETQPPSTNEDEEEYDSTTTGSDDSDY